MSVTFCKPERSRERRVYVRTVDDGSKLNLDISMECSSSHTPAIHEMVSRYDVVFIDVRSRYGLTDSKYRNSREFQNGRWVRMFRNGRVERRPSSTYELATMNIHALYSEEYMFGSGVAVNVAIGPFGHFAVRYAPALF